MAFSSQNVSAEVLVLHNIRKHLLNIGRVDSDGFLLQIRPFEGNVVEKLLHDGVQAPRADILGAFVYRGGKAGHLLHGVVKKRELDALGFEQSDILLDQGILRLSEYADKVFDRKRIQFDANREAALKLGNEIGGFRDVKCPGGDKKDVIGAHE